MVIHKVEYNMGSERPAADICLAEISANHPITADPSAKSITTKYSPQNIP